MEQLQGTLVYPSFSIVTDLPEIVITCAVGLDNNRLKYKRVLHWKILVKYIMCTEKYIAHAKTWIYWMVHWHLYFTVYNHSALGDLN
jgi:hypothetical protein